MKGFHKRHIDLRRYGSFEFADKAGKDIADSPVRRHRDKRLSCFTEPVVVIIALHTVGDAGLKVGIVPVPERFHKAAHGRRGSKTQIGQIVDRIRLDASKILQQMTEHALIGALFRKKVVVDQQVFKSSHNKHTFIEQYVFVTDQL